MKLGLLAAAASTFVEGVGEDADIPSEVWLPSLKVLIVGREEQVVEEVEVELI